MKWATRIGMKTDRVACAWLIRNHIDRDAEFFFFPTDRLIDEAKKIGATTFDAAGADFPHIGMRCAFEVMMDHYGLWGKDPALDHMAMIVHASDVNIKLYDFTVLEAFGLWALAQGFGDSVPDDHEKLTVVVPMYEALYRWCKTKIGTMKLSTYKPDSIRI
jgi:hypothetical protein